MKPNKRFFIMGAALLVIAATFVSGTWFGYSSRPEIERITGVLHKEIPSDIKNANEIDFEPFWKAWRLVESKHVGEEDINREKLVWGAIQGMVASLGDPYTVFLPPVELKDFESEIKGEFSGIGAEIGIRKDILTIIAPIKGSPAEKSGLKAGDKVLKIDDKFTSELTLDEAVHLIRGEQDTTVLLTIARNDDDKPREVKVTRNVIKLPAITTGKEKDDIFRIQLHSFTQKSGDDFANAVREFLQSGSKKLIVDLRNNPGGFLNESIEIASWWLPEGEIVTQEVYKDRDPNLYKSYGFGSLEDIPTVILVNRGSASASEIPAGALKEHKKPVLIGEKAFGKGSVQELEPITDGTSLKVTIAKWVTPNGISISKEGLMPDIEVKISEDTKPGEDPVLKKAIEYLEGL